MAVTFARSNRTLKLELRSSKDARKAAAAAGEEIPEAAECWGRGRLTFDQHTEVEAAQFRREFVFDPKVGSYVEKRYISAAKMRQALLWAWIADGLWGCNWIDESGTAITRVSQVNECLSRENLTDLGDELLYEHYPEWYSRPEIEVDEKGNPVDISSDDQAASEQDPTSDSSTTDESRSISSPEDKRTFKSEKTGSSPKS